MAFSTQGQGQDSMTIPPPQHPLMAPPPLPPVQRQILPQSQPELHLPYLCNPLQLPWLHLPSVSLQPSTGMLRSKRLIRVSLTSKFLVQPSSAKCGGLETGYKDSRQMFQHSDRMFEQIFQISFKISFGA